MSISASALAVSVDDIVDALVATVPQPPEDKTSVIVEGEMGIGKSSILKELGKKLPEHLPIYFDCTTKADAGDVMMPKFKDLDGQDYVSFATNEELGMVDQKVYIRDLVEMTSKDLPVTMDSRTVWVGFQKGPELKSVIYQFLLTSRDIQSLSETDIEKMKTNQTRQVDSDYCTNPQYTFIRTHGITSEYRYSDKNFKYLFSVFSKDLSCEN